MKDVRVKGHSWQATKFFKEFTSLNNKNIRRHLGLKASYLSNLKFEIILVDSPNFHVLIN